LISDTPSSVITGVNFGGVLNKDGYPVDLTTISNIYLRRELEKFDFKGETYISLFAMSGGNKVFAGYINETRIDSLAQAQTTVKFMDVQSSLVANSYFDEASTGSRIYYQIYRPELGNCKESFSFIHDGNINYEWEENAHKYEYEQDHRVEWRGCGLEILKQVLCESVASGFEGIGIIVGSLLDEVRISEKYYNPEDPNYNPILLESFKAIIPTFWV